MSSSRLLVELVNKRLGQNIKPGLRKSHKKNPENTYGALYKDTLNDQSIVKIRHAYDTWM